MVDPHHLFPLGMNGRGTLLQSFKRLIRTFCVLKIPDCLNGIAQFSHIADGCKLISLIKTIFPISVFRVSVAGLQNSDFVIIMQGLHVQSE